MVLEIKKEQISQLRDDELRELVAKLCIATLKKYNISSDGVLFGGNQDSSDGGVDIRIKTNIPDEVNDYIDNENTIIQVKVPKMPARKIKQEMMIDGKLKESIKKLKDVRGKYVIVSSSDDVTDSQYNERIKAMRECIGNLNIEVDFYDCQRIASWANEYCGICMWVHEKNGLILHGWNSIDGWRSMYPDFDNELIFDDETFIYKDSYSDNNKISILDSIKEIRKKISIPKQVIRIAGLSGVGKTRFVYSLFDKRIGDDAVNTDLLLYCDIGNNSNPFEMIDYLIQNRIRSIVVIDNCEKEAHINLAKLCQKSDSILSLITIEYDAKEDDIVESSNYYMCSSSDDVIRRFIYENFESIHEANINTIVECSGGNFRLAKYLASSINGANGIGILNSNELFSRLFVNKNNDDKELLETAEICSLLFSFDINSELNILSKLTSLDYNKLYKNIAELEEMQLVQSRGNWRAILPHALANKLVCDCLKKIKHERIIETLANNDRMILSFSRRLKYLFSSTDAVSIAKKMLNLDFFDDIRNISDNKVKAMKNLSFVVPNVVLDKISRIDDDEFYSRENPNFNELVDILINIAYDSDKFDLACLLLVKFASTEDKGENNCSILSRICNLFHLYLSGTYATLTQRINFVEQLIGCNNSKYKEIGLNLLDELLQTGTFYGNYVNIESHRKDYGYRPNSEKEIKEWYEKVLLFCKIQINKRNKENEILDIISNNFRGLIDVGLVDKLSEFVCSVLKKKSWPEIWVSIRSYKYYCKKNINGDLLKVLNKLESMTKPKSLRDKYSVFVASNNRVFFSIDDITENRTIIDNKVYGLGVSYSKNIDALLDDLDYICNYNGYKDHTFGKGLAKDVKIGEKIIQLFFDKLPIEKLDNKKTLLSGIICGISNDKVKVRELLEKVLNNNKIRHLYPSLQTSYILENDDIDLVIQSLEYDNIPLLGYTDIAYRTENVSTKKNIELINSIPCSDDGMNLKILLINNLIENGKLNQNNFKFCAEIISNYNYCEKFNNRLAYHEISNISEKIFKEPNLEKYVEIIFSKIKKCMNNHFLSFYDYETLMSSMIANYSELFLNTFVMDASENYRIRNFLDATFHKRPLSYISDDILVNWIESNNKYADIIHFLKPFVYDEANKCYVWTKIGEIFIEKINDTNDDSLLLELTETIYPKSWDENIPNILKQRIPLIDYLFQKVSPSLKKVVVLAKSKLLQRIELEIEFFSNERKNMFNSFE